MGDFNYRSDVDGVSELLAKIEGMRKSAQTKIVKPMVKAGVKVVLAAAKAKLAGYGFKSSSPLLKALGDKIGVGKDGTVFGIVGPRRGYKVVRGADGQRVKMLNALGNRYAKKGIDDPVRYAHLVEKGTAPHALGKGSTLPREGRKGELTAGSQSGNMHPGSKAQPFLRPAIDEHKDEVKSAMAAVAAVELEKLAKGS